MSREALVGLHWRFRGDRDIVLVVRNLHARARSWGDRHRHRHCKTNVIRMKTEVRSGFQGRVSSLTRDSRKDLPKEVIVT